MYLPKRDELLLFTVLALPNASSTAQQKQNNEHCERKAAEWKHAAASSPPRELKRRYRDHQTQCASKQTKQSLAQQAESALHSPSAETDRGWRRACAT